MTFSRSCLFFLFFCGRFSLASIETAIALSNPPDSASPYSLFNYNQTSYTQTSVSLIAGSSTFGDPCITDIPPPIPFLDSVSVDITTNKATVSWFVSEALDTKGYIIYIPQDGGGGDLWNAIDTVYGRNTTFYSYALSRADTVSEKFAVAVLDSCNLRSPISTPTSQSTIYLNVRLDVCKDANELVWNKYLNWPAGVKKYEVWVRENQGPYTLLTSNQPDNTTYSHSGLNYASTYHYFIRATDGSGLKTSSSNVDSVFIATPKPPAFNYLANSTVKSEGQVDLLFYTDSLGQATSFNILRSTSASGPFVKVGTIANTGLGSYTFTDKEVNTAKSSYYYQILAVDNCENTLTASNINRTIFLKGEASIDLVNSLSWNPFESWKGRVESYKVFRSVGGVFEPQPIAILDSSTTTYNDDVAAFKDYSGSFCYYVEAVEGDSNSGQRKEVSRSNPECVKQVPRVYIPNAFTPNGDGLNDEFFPVTSFVEIQDYIFIIYNRRGQKIFETTDKLATWDGKVKGETAPTGIYGYYFSVTLPQGNSFEKGGTVTLIR